MNRFFIPGDCFHDLQVQFPQDVSDQIRRVLRLKNGDQVVVLDNSGKAFLTTLFYPSPNTLLGEIQQEIAVESEPVLPFTCFLPLTRREKFEWMLQKCTEAGAAKLIPFISERCLVQDRSDALQKMPRWQKIVCEAAEQSGRGILPSLQEPLDFQHAISHSFPQAQKLFFWEEEQTHQIAETVRHSKGKPNQIVLITGPEGGFSTAEAEAAAANDWQVTTLGKRILRAETAALAALLLTIYEIERTET